MRIIYGIMQALLRNLPSVTPEQKTDVLDKIRADIAMYEADCRLQGFEKFAKEYGFKDYKEVYTNGSDLIPIYRVKQWLEHDNKLRTIEIDTAYECGKHANKWIPVSEKLPNDRDWYLGIFKEPDTGWTNPLPFVCDYVGHETKATTKEHWILRGFTDRDEHIDYYFNLECVAWMQLPKPYKSESEE